MLQMNFPSIVSPPIYKKYRKLHKNVMLSFTVVFYNNDMVVMATLYGISMPAKSQGPKTVRLWIQSKLLKPLKFLQICRGSESLWKYIIFCCCWILLTSRQLFTKTIWWNWYPKVGVFAEWCVWRWTGIKNMMMTCLVGGCPCQAPASAVLGFVPSLRVCWSGLQSFVPLSHLRYVQDENLACPGYGDFDTFYFRQSPGWTKDHWEEEGQGQPLTGA